MISRRLEDGRILTVYLEIFGTAALAIDDNPLVRGTTERDERIKKDAAAGKPTRAQLLGEQDSDGGFDFYFQYPSLESALAAFNEMQAGDAEPPDGWVRAAPPYFRRRPGGDPELEHVRE